MIFGISKEQKKQTVFGKLTYPGRGGKPSKKTKLLRILQSKTLLGR